MMRRKHEAAAVAAIYSEAMPRIEIVSDRRRLHDAAFRAGVVAECAWPGVRVQKVAARHGVCPSLIYRWRRASAAASAAKPIVRLFPVRIAPVDDPPPLPPPATARRRAGSNKLMIAKLNRERFGSSSERHRKLIDQMVLVPRSDDGHAADRGRFIYPFDSAGLGLELSETVMSNPDAIVIRTDATSI